MPGRPQIVKDQLKNRACYVVVAGEDGLTLPLTDEVSLPCPWLFLQDVGYPEFLNIRPYMSQSNGEPVMYGLYAVLVHSGYSCHAGHYYCYVKVSAFVWRCVCTPPAPFSPLWARVCSACWYSSKCGLCRTFVHREWPCF